MRSTSPALILPDEKVPDYFSGHLTELLEADPSPAAVLKTRLLSMPAGSRNRLKTAIMSTLTASNQSLTDHVLERIDGGALPPTVANWIQDFGSYQKLQWQAKSPAWAKLDASDQLYLGKFFELIRVLSGDTDDTRSGGPPTAAEPIQTFVPSIQLLADTAGVTLETPLLHNRFGTVIRSAIKGIRSSGQLAEIISRPVDQGGVGLNSTAVQKVVAAVAPLVAQYARGELILDEHKLKVPHLETMAAPVMPVFDSEAQTRGAAVVELEPIAAPVVMSPQRLDRFSSPRPNAPMPMPPVSFAPVRRVSQPRRAIIHDIRQPRSKLVGPIEELHRLDLASFHRLGPDAVSIVQKIKEKIDLLASESLTKKAEGVKAWKQSPVNQLYLAIGAASMSLGKSVEAVINDRATGGEPVLTTVEFRTIADLNKALRF